MSEEYVLVDTSIWIDFFSQSKTGQSILGQLIEQNRVVINSVIRLELLTGAKDEAQYQELIDYLQGLFFVSIEEDTWYKAQRLRFDLRRDGFLIPVPDVLIAVTALIEDLQLFHEDDHFEQIAKRRSLKRYTP